MNYASRRVAVRPQSRRSGASLTLATAAMLVIILGINGLLNTSTPNSPFSDAIDDTGGSNSDAEVVIRVQNDLSIRKDIGHTLSLVRGSRKSLFEAEEASVKNRFGVDSNLENDPSDENVIIENDDAEPRDNVLLFSDDEGVDNAAVNNKIANENEFEDRDAIPTHDARTQVHEPDKPLKVFYILPSIKLLQPEEAKAQFNVTLVNFDRSLQSAIRYDLYPYPHVFIANDDMAEQFAALCESSQAHAGLREFTNPLAMVKMLRNKWTFCRYLHENGFREIAPKCYERIEDIPKYPVVLKPRLSSGSDSVHFATNSQRLKEAIEDLQLNVDPRKKLFIIQEYVESKGKERALYFVAYRGRIVRFVCLERTLVRYILHLSKKDKKYPPPYLTKEQCHYSIFESLVAKLEYHGIGNFDFRIDAKTMRPKIHEMNPRLAATLVANATLLADFVCAFQFRGRGKLSSDGCVEGSD